MVGISFFISSHFTTIFFFFSIALISFIILYILYTEKKIKSLRKNIETLEKTIHELDHQAKLIIREDLELKLYQEEIIDKLKKLSFLKNFIRSSLNILDREELFAQIDKYTIESLGFEKGAIVALPSNDVKVNVGFTSQELYPFMQFIKNNQAVILTSSLVSPDIEVAEELKRKTSLKDFLLAPIISGANLTAIFIVANCISPEGITDAEKEVFSIICMYLGQCLDNIKSFEAVYQAGEELESKIKEKTFELKKTLEEIEHISKMKSEFISSVSHELRTPLTSIKGFSSLLVAEKFGKLPPEAKERLKKIDENVNKLVDMVNTLLDISRIESKRIEVNIVKNDLTKLIKDVCDFLMPQIESKKINLKIETPPSLFVYMDKNLIERVLINLINNAIKFTPMGGEIKVGCKIKEDKVIVSVQDTGCGIAKEDLEKIFQEFFRADNPINRQVKGTGLGLSLVKRIIDIHKERIWVESELNKGTTFYFTLKLAQNE